MRSGDRPRRREDIWLGKEVRKRRLSDAKESRARETGTTLAWLCTLEDACSTDHELSQRLLSKEHEKTGHTRECEGRANGPDGGWCEGPAATAATPPCAGGQSSASHRSEICEADDRSARVMGQAGKSCAATTHPLGRVRQPLRPLDFLARGKEDLAAALERSELPLDRETTEVHGEPAVAERRGEVVELLEVSLVGLSLGDVRAVQLVEVFSEEDEIGKALRRLLRGCVGLCKELVGGRL